MDTAGQPRAGICCVGFWPVLARAETQAVSGCLLTHLFAAAGVSWAVRKYQALKPGWLKVLGGWPKALKLPVDLRRHKVMRHLV